ncbi:MAG TPA: Rieske 2Fe-2S domain-containing protein, partial [Candidatus Deferrimicrobium sp.]|nr:Rieske 2Fe-2S domain-containing protein [Candidatus Deferrimicrobium sp.]
MEFSEFVHTGPETLAGRFLRRFWQPVACSHELSAGQALPLRILSEDFTLYRGAGGTAHLVGNRCAHRGTQLSAGWVEEDCIRCFYHGWKYDGAGQCVEQPAEGESFAAKVRIASYPVKEYLGLVFAYLGAGEAPSLPRYPRFESPEISLDVAGLKRICNYFNNVDNSLDNAHLRFVHRRHRDAAEDHVVLGDPIISVEESDWGIRRYVKYPDGKDLTFFFGMPNINFINGQVVDPVIKRADVMVFKVPVDDENHIHFEVRAIALSGAQGRAWIEERRALRAKVEEERPELVRAILAGKLRLSDIDPQR